MKPIRLDQKQRTEVYNFLKSEATIKNGTDLIDQWTSFRRTDKSQAKRLDIFIDPKGRQLATLIRRKDGTLVYRQRNEEGKLKQSDYLSNNWDFLISDLTEYARQTVYNLAARRFGSKKIITILDMPYYTRRILDECIKEATQDVMNQVLARYVLLSGVKAITPSSVRNPWNRLIYNQIRNHFFDQDVLSLTRALFGRWQNENFRQLPLSAYNHTMANRRVFKQMMAGAPAVLAYYATQLAKIHAGLRPFRHPDEITRLVRDALDVSPRAWRIFTNLTPKHGWRSLSPEELSLALQAIAEANPKQIDEKIISIIDRTHHHNFFRLAAYDHGSPWRLWIHLINQYLDSSSSDSRFYPVADALRAHVENSLPWSLTDWESYVRRSEHWHEQLHQQQQQKMEQEIAEAVWTSPVQGTSIGKHVFSPILDGPSLMNAGKTMRNCLGTYWRRCQQGRSLIFLAYEDGRLVAAVELINRGKDWSVGQIEGHQFKRQVPNSVKTATAHLKAQVQLATLCVAIWPPWKFRIMRKH